MLVCVIAAGIVMVAVALPQLRQGARVLTPSGRAQIKDARRRAVYLARQGRERATTVSDQARTRLDRSATAAPGSTTEQAEQVEGPETEIATPATGSAAPAPAPSTPPQTGGTATTEPAQPEDDVIDVRAIEEALSTVSAPVAQPVAAGPTRASAKKSTPAKKKPGAPTPRPAKLAHPAETARTAAPKQARPATSRPAKPTHPETPARAEAAGRTSDRPVPGVVPGISPRSAHRMSLWNPTASGPRHAR